MSTSLHTDINMESLNQLATFSDDTPLHMVNYLKYKQIDEESGRTGKEIYKEYMEKAIPFFQQINADITFKAKPALMIIGPTDESLWDEILIVTYASKNDFFKLVQMEGYPGDIRKQALSDSRIICCK
ncbi:MAG: hypothetical protein AAFO99_09720 [Bacteroidota bacterium]